MTKGISSSSSRKKTSPLVLPITLGVLGFVLLFAAFGGFNSIIPSAPGSTATEFSFRTLDASSGDLLSSVDDYDNPDADIDIWECDISSLTATEIEDLTFSDFVLTESGHADVETLEPEDEFFYLANISVAGFSEAWFQYTDGTPAFIAGMETMILGLNTAYLVNETSDATIAAIGTDENHDLSTIVADTTARSWTVNFAFDTSDDGVAQEYDTANDRWNYFVIIIDTNLTTASSSYVSTPTNEVSPVEKVASGAYIYLFFSGRFIDEGSIRLRFDSGIHSVYDLDDIAVGYGSPDAVGSITEYAAQV